MDCSDCDDNWNTLLFSGGIYLFYNPIWIPIDLKLIRKVLVTDYDYFASHGFFHHKKDFISDHIFSKEGEEWKVLRSHLSPTFTPAKLKNMYHTLYKFGHRMEEQSKLPQLEYILYKFSWENKLKF